MNNDWFEWCNLKNGDVYFHNFMNEWFPAIVIKSPVSDGFGEITWKVFCNNKIIEDSVGITAVMKRAVFRNGVNMNCTKSVKPFMVIDY